MTLRLAWFATARGKGSRLLLEKTQTSIRLGELDAEIAVVFCNRNRGESSNTDLFLDTVQESGTPLVTISSNEWRRRVNGEFSDPEGKIAAWRSDYDRAVREAIEPYGAAAGLLAGYMLITTNELCEKIPLLNLHPSSPDGPVGTWEQVITALIDSHATMSGIMLQRVTTELDKGPVVTMCRYPLRGNGMDELWKGHIEKDDSLFQAIREEGLKRESYFLIASLSALASGRVNLPNLNENIDPCDLSTEIELSLSLRQSR